MIKTKINAVIIILVIAVFFIFSIFFRSGLKFYKIDISNQDLSLSNLLIISDRGNSYLTNDFTIKSIGNSIISDLYVEIISDEDILFDSYSKLDDLDLNNEKVIVIDNVLKSKCNLEKNKKITINLKYKINKVEKKEKIDLNLDEYLEKIYIK